MKPRAWQVLLMAVSLEEAARLRDSIDADDETLAGEAVQWQLAACDDGAALSSACDAMIFCEPPNARPGLAWLGQRLPDAQPPVVLLLPRADPREQAQGEQSGALVLVLDQAPQFGSLLRAALIQTLRLAQAQARSQELQRILENVHDAVIVIDRQGKITGWSGAAQQMYGWTAQEAEGQLATRLLEIPLAPDVLLHLGQELNGGRMVALELDQRNRAGDSLYVETTAIPLADARGRLENIVVLNRNFTARKLAQEALQTSNQALENALSSLVQASITLEHNGRIIAISPSAARIFFDERPAHLLVGQVFWEIYHAPAADLFVQKVGTALSSGQMAQFEAQAAPPNGWYEVYVFPHDQLVDLLFHDISERKQAELEREALMAALGHERLRLAYLVDSLQTSEGLFRATFDNALVGIAHVSTNGNWLKVNDRLCEITGYRREELITLNIQTITYPDELPNDMQQMNRLLRGALSGYQIEKRYIRKDGGVVWVHLSVALQRDEYDHPEYFIVVVQDIQQRKRLEGYDHFLIDLGERLARAETQATMVELTRSSLCEQMQASRCLVAQIDPLTQQVTLLPADPQALSTLCESGDLDLYPPDTVADLQRRQQVVVAESTSTSPDTRATACAYVHTSFTRPLSGVGVVTVLSSQPRHWDDVDLSLLRAVTDLLWLHLEKVSLLDSLRQSEDRLRLVLDSSGITVFGQGLSPDAPSDSTWVYNPNASADISRLVSVAEGGLLTPEQAARFHQVKQNVLASGQAQQLELQFGPPEQPSYFLLVIEAARDAIGRVNGLLAVAMDISARRQSEEAVLQYAHRLERSNRDLEDFAHIASHDLQEPLRKVRAFGRLLAEDERLAADKNTLDYLERILSAVDRMQRMINDLLTYSRVTTTEQIFLPVDLGEVIADVLLDLEITVQHSGGQVQVSELPSIEADRLQMQQLLQNLIANALKFHQPGQAPHVQVSAQSIAGERIELTVADDGIGFQELYLERIFQPFQRLHGRSEYEGSGIGLAICRKIAERHGGSITAHSQPNQGSTFVVTLPVHH